MPGNSLAARFVVLLVIAIWIALHVPLLILPYYWDEAGYFIPAAYDFYTKGAIIVQSVVAEPHPPLVAVMVAIAWKAFGFSAVVARSVVLFLGAAALWGIFRLSSRVTNPQVGFNPKPENRQGWRAAPSPRRSGAAPNCCVTSNPALFFQPAERGLRQRSALSLPITKASQTSVWIQFNAPTRDKTA